jgi:hypothetical protein
MVEPVSALSRFLEALPDLRDIAEAASLVLILIVCLVLSKPRLPQGFSWLPRRWRYFLETCPAFSRMNRA